MTTSKASLLPNFLAGRWQTGGGHGQTLWDPVTGEALARVDNTGLNLAEGFAFAREQGGTALRAMSYGQRAAILAQVVKGLQANRDAYYDIATRNCGTVKSGQQCTAIRREFVPRKQYAALGARLAPIRVGNPCNEGVRMGALVSREQFDHVMAGIAHLKTEVEVLFDGNHAVLVDADPAVAACVAPVLLCAPDPVAAKNRAACACWASTTAAARCRPARLPWTH